MKDSLPNMDEVVKRLKARMKAAKDGGAMYAFAKISDLGLLIEERERSLIYENELIEVIRKDRERIAEQDKEIQRLQEENAQLQSENEMYQLRKYSSGYR